MGVLIENLPIDIKKKKINYEEFIYILSEKANLNRSYKAKIEGKGIETFDENEEQKLMEIDSVKGLYNLII